MQVSFLLLQLFYYLFLSFKLLLKLCLCHGSHADNFIYSFGSLHLDGLCRNLAALCLHVLHRLIENLLHISIFLALIIELSAQLRQHLISDRLLKNHLRRVYSACASWTVLLCWSLKWHVDVGIVENLQAIMFTFLNHGLRMHDRWRRFVTAALLFWVYHRHCITTYAFVPVAADSPIKSFFCLCIAYCVVHLLLFDALQIKSKIINLRHELK